MFTQLVRAEIAAGLDETHRFETWAEGVDGRMYYDVHLAVIDQYETSAPLLRELLGDHPKRVLESGCGTGRWLAYCARRGHWAVGIDHSAAALSAARRRDATLRLVRGDIASSSFRPGSFDVVISAYAAEHLPAGLDAVLRELHRLLTPGGALVLIVPVINWLRGAAIHPALRLYYLAARLRRVPLAFTEHRFSRRELVAAVRSAGFAIERLLPDDYRLPWAKGLCVDLGGLVKPRRAPPGSWELNRAARLLARALNALSPWAACAGALIVARR
jgi:SAM-dependent methyltransferase